MIIFLIIALLAFFAGYALGNIKEPDIKKIRKSKTDPILERQKREYENFLNYDGSEQP